MQISSRFTIAVHIFMAIDIYEKDYKLTSDFLAASIRVNSVDVRKITQQLKAAGLIKVKRGSGGASIAKPLNEITFFDVFYAVESIEDGKLFHFHDNPNPECSVGRNIHGVLDDRLFSIQEAMEQRMREITIEDVIHDIRRSIEQENK